jgi:hypothetical protein
MIADLLGASCKIEKRTCLQRGRAAWQVKQLKKRYYFNPLLGNGVVLPPGLWRGNTVLAEARPAGRNDFAGR